MPEISEIKARTTAPRSFGGTEPARLPHEEVAHEERTFELAAIWERLQRRWAWIAGTAGGATALALVAALLLPSWYRASASLLPPNEEDSGVGISSLLKGIGVPGVKVPKQSEPADVFVAILKSSRVNEEIVRRFDLRARYHQKLTVDALRELARHTRFDVDDAGIIEIQVEDGDPHRAADMANAYVVVLDRFKFVGQRLADTETQLHQAEEAYAAYQATHKAPPLSPDAMNAQSSVASLYAQREALQVRLGVIQGYTQGESDEARQIRAELAQLDRRLQEFPETGIASLRLLRELKTLEQLRALLTAQYEQARIDEVRDVSTLEPLDVATPPEKRARPQRALLVLTGLLLGLGAGAALALMERDPTQQT
ncbi:MAG: hypothetical protein E6J87_15490 [Deltaproteobacteria bacterium]|nr:MAG: hypothetical protein E6J87_15490 [Deltaproteobacteria bacterium]